MNKNLYLILAAILFSLKIVSQPVNAPSCPTQSIYAHNGSIINGHTLPNGPATNVLTNLPAGAGGLAIGPAFGFPAPNPTWWTTNAGTYWYYSNAGTWVNTGHALTNGAAVNLGGAATCLYNLVGGTGQIYRYNGTGNDVLLTTLVPAFGGAGPYDVQGDMANNFYILRGSTPQGIFCYNPQGVLTCSWSISGMLQQSAGGGFCILTTANPSVHMMYYNSNGTDYIGNIIPGNSNIISTVQALPGGGDYASCALPIPIGTITAPQGGSLTCGISQIPLVALVNGNQSLGWTGGYGSPTVTMITPTCGSILWSGPGIVSGQGTPTIMVNTPGVYTYTVNGCNGCPNYSITASFTVVGTGGILTPLITAPTCFVAPSTTMAVSPSGTNTVVWSGPGIIGPNNIFTITINQPGTYTAVVSSGTACSGTATFVVNPTPTINAVANPTQICTGGFATLTASGAGTGGTYTWNPGAVPGPSMVVSPSVTTIYTVSGTSSVGCAGTRTVQLNVAPNPTIIATPNPSAICLGQQVSTVTLSGAQTYTTNPGNIVNPTFTLSPALTTTYTVIGTSSAGCAGSGSFQIIVNPVPIPTATNNGPICSGGLLNLSVTAASTYTWSGPNAFNSNLQNPSIAGATAINAGVYSVVVTNSSGCTGSATTTVVVNPLPVITPTNGGPYCVGSVISLSVGPFVSYSWSGPAGFISLLQNPSIVNGQLTNAGVYTVTVTGVGGCQSSGTTNVVMNPNPTPTATSNSPVCLGKPLNLIGNGGTTYTWTGPNGYTSNQQNPIIAVAQNSNAGTYTLSVTNGNGCVNFSTISVIINPLPVIVVNNPIACVNQTLNFTANGGITYQWSGPLGFSSVAQNPSITNAQLNMSGAYTVLVTSAQGCTATAVANATVITLPQPTISSSSPNCVGTTLTFTGSGGTSYSWNGPNGFSSLFQNPSIPNVQLAASGIYTLVVTAGNCTNVTTASVTINPLPTPTATNNSPVCLGQVLNLIGSGGTTYTWTGPNGYTSNQQNPVIAVAQNSNAGTYTLTVTDPNNCVNSITSIFVVNPLPTITTNNQLVCFGSTLNHNANGGVSYSWTGPNGFISNLQNPSIPNVTQANAGQYLVIGTSAFGCTNTAVSNVSVNTPPMPVIVSNTPCVGGVLNLTGNGGTSYTWTAPNGFISNLATPSVTNVTLQYSGIYTLVISAGNCTAMTTANVMVDPIPVPNMISNSPLCEHDNLQMYGLNGYSYVWSGPNNYNGNGSNISFVNVGQNHAGTYTAIATDMYGCSGTGTISIVVNSLPMIGTKGSTLCEHAVLTLTASGGTGYAWTGPGGFTSSLQNISVPNASAGMAGDYTVTVTDANNCKASAVVNVSINPSPLVDISSNSPICAGGDIVLNSNSPTTVLYYWHGPLNWMSTLQNPRIKNVGANASGTYTIHVHDEIGCTTEKTIDVLVRALPNVNITTDKYSSCVPLCVNLGQQSSNQIVSSNWLFGNGDTGAGNTASYCFNTAGHYVISSSYTDNYGCKNTSTLAVDAWPIPVADFNILPSRPVVNENVEFSDATREARAAAWTWYFSDKGTNVRYGSVTNRIFENEGSYEAVMIVISDHGCKDTVVKPVFVGEDFGLYVPDAFSPNGDGVNDTFFPKGYGITRFEMNIFDRWGEKLYSTEDIIKGWDGKYQGRGGEEVKQDVYVWKIKLMDSHGKAHTMAGKVTLIK